MPNENYQSNLPEVLRKIKEAQERALEKIGLLVEGEAKLRCVVDTGNLRNSIDHKVNLSDLSVAIGTNVEYAIYVEMGTSRQQAQPYLEPAATDNTAKIKQIVESELSNLR